VTPNNIALAYVLNQPFPTFRADRAAHARGNPHDDDRRWTSSSRRVKLRWLNLEA